MPLDGNRVSLIGSMSMGSKKRSCSQCFPGVYTCVMKQYVIDDLRPSDHAALKDYLDEHLKKTGIDGLYHLGLPESLLSPVQSAHTQCHPLYLSVELVPEALVCELLVRTDSRVRCDCMGYTTPDQRNWAIETMDAIADKLALIN